MKIVERYTKGKTVLLITHDKEEAAGHVPLEWK